MNYKFPLMIYIGGMPMFDDMDYLDDIDDMDDMSPELKELFESGKRIKKLFNITEKDIERAIEEVRHPERIKENRKKERDQKRKRKRTRSRSYRLELRKKRGIYIYILNFIDILILEPHSAVVTLKYCLFL